MKSYRFSIVLFSIIILLLILDISLFAQNNPRNDLIPVPEKPLKPGWKRILIHNVGKIDIPPTMEVQKGKYKEVKEYALKKKYKRLKKYFKNGERIVIQQKGLNDLDPNAFKLYVRVIIETTLLKPGEAELLSSELSLSENELREFSEMAKLEVQKLKFTKILQWNPPLIKDMNGMKAIYISYRRQLKKNPPVFVQTYAFLNYDRIHQLILSYRENEKHLWQRDLNDIVSSFVITNIRKGKEEPKIKDTMSIVMSILFGEDWSILFGENWPLGLILGLIISAILTWGIGLAPPLLIRFVFLKRPLKKMTSIIVVVFFWFLNLIIFTALGSRSKTHIALFFVAFVSYYILRAGSKRNQKMDSTAKQGKKMITLNSAIVKKAMAWIDAFLTKFRGIKHRPLRNLEVSKILDEVKCPKCDSTQLTAQRKGFSYGRGIAGIILIGPIGWLVGYIRSKEIRITCLRCGFRWEPGQKDLGKETKAKKEGPTLADRLMGRVGEEGHKKNQEK